MSEAKKPPFALDERTALFAAEIRKFVRQLPKSISNIEDGKQIVRSSGSVGANYLEARDALSRKDFAMRVKISRKEASETRYWLRLLDVPKELAQTRITLADEAEQLIKILTAIAKKADHS